MEKLNNSEAALNDFVIRINECISELRLADDNLVKQVENDVLTAFGIENNDFDALRKNIRKRYKNIKVNFYIRVKRLY